MTVKSWTLEFFPATPTTKMTNLQAVQHSLQKWRGLRETNRMKHSVKLLAAGWHGPWNTWRQPALVGSGHLTFPVDGTTCALCMKHVDRDDREDCVACPITRATGQPCDGSRNKGKSPWEVFTDYSNPESMIAVLEKAEAYLLKEQARKRK